MDFRATVRAAVAELDDGGMASVPVVIDLLKRAGAVSGIHVGNKDLTEQQVLEWYAGQVLSILESENWFAVNSIVNALDRFAPEKP